MVSLALGLIPPRPMQTAAEVACLESLATGARCVVNIGVYEGSSAVMFCDALGEQAQLHLIDPFVDEDGWALRDGWRASPTSTRMAVARRVRHGGPRLHWHLERSQDVGRSWSGLPVDLLFVDGDHSPEAVREDWEVWRRHIAPAGAVAFHDARLGCPGGSGGPGPTSVTEHLFRAPAGSPGWHIVDEVDSLVVVRRSA
jgi:predicted O-methyltransferase YrrM